MTRDERADQSDWEDQDLLTLDEAEERLAAELTATADDLERATAALARAHADGGDADRLAAAAQLHERRHRALREALERVRAMRAVT